MPGSNDEVLIVESKTGHVREYRASKSRGVIRETFQRRTPTNLYILEPEIQYRGFIVMRLVGEVFVLADPRLQPTRVVSERWGWTWELAKG